MLRCALPPQIFKFSVYVTIPVLLTVAFAGSPQNLQAIITNVRVQRWRTLARAAQDLRLHASRLAPCPHHSGRTWSIPPRVLVHRALRRFGRCVSADERVGVVSRRSARDLAMLAMPHSRTLCTPYYGHWKRGRTPANKGAATELCVLHCHTRFSHPVHSLRKQCRAR